MDANTTHTGTIKKILDERGFGFIIPDALGRDVYFQVKDLVGFPAVKSLPDDTKVTFKLTEHQKGLRATQVKSV
jgi:cold shock protein